MRLFSAAALATFVTLLAGSASAEVIHEQGEAVEGAVKEMIKVTPSGLQPSTITFKKLDGSLFLVNTTKDALVTYEVAFGKHQPHCASDNMKYDQETGTMKSIKPVGPKDFAAMCFPESGTYDFKVFGVGPKPLTGKIIVDRSL